LAWCRGIAHLRQFRTRHHAKRQQRHQQIDQQRGQHRQQRGAPDIFGAAAAVRGAGAAGV
jgi:hypothetical protein